MNISLAHLAHRAADVARWLATPTPAVHTIWYGTFDELWGNAQFHWVAADACEDAVHALTALWRAHLEHIEEITLTPAHLEFFLRTFRAGRGYGTAAVFAPMHVEEWQTEIALVTGGIVDAITAVRHGRQRPPGNHPAMFDGPLNRGNPSTYWGIFVDGNRVDDERAFHRSAWLPGAFLEGCAIRRAWNNQELFVRTTAAYVLFTWSTGA